MGIYIFDTSGAYTALVGFGEDYGDPNGPITEAYRVLVQGMAPAPLEKYKKLRVAPYIESRRTKPNADFASSDPLILSQRAVDSLGPALKECGILYPLEAIGVAQEYWLFHVTNIVNALNMEECKGWPNRWYPDKSNAKYSALRYFVMDHAKLEGRNTFVFRVPEYPESYIFMNEEFKNMVERCKLTSAVLHPENTDMMEKGIVLNKNVKHPLDDDSKAKAPQKPTLARWAKLIKELVEKCEWDKLIDLRDKVNSFFASKGDADGLRAFYEKAAKQILPKEKAALFLNVELSGLVKEVERSLCELKAKIEAGSTIKAVYFEYYYDGGFDNDGSFFMCNDYDADGDGWVVDFNGKDAIVTGIQLPAFFQFDPDEEWGDMERTVALEVADGLFLSVIMQAWGSADIALPLAYARHGERTVIVSHKT